MTQDEICKKYVESLTADQLKEEIKESPFLIRYMSNYNVHDMIDINIEVVHEVYPQLTYGDIKKVISTHEDAIELTLDNKVNVFNTLRNVMLSWKNIDEQYDFFYTFLPLTKFKDKDYTFELYGCNGHDKQIFLSKNQIIEMSEKHTIYIEESKLYDCIKFYCKEDESFVYTILKNQLLQDNYVFDIVELVPLEYDKSVKLIREVLTETGHNEHLSSLIHECIRLNDLQVFNDISFLDIKEHTIFIFCHYLNEGKRIPMTYPELVQKVYVNSVEIEKVRLNGNLASKYLVFPLKLLIKNKWNELWKR